MKMFFIRLQDMPGYREVLPEVFGEYCDVIAVKHTGRNHDNPHYHILMRSNIKGPALRARLRKMFCQGQGNRHMSIKRIESDDEYEKVGRYVMHEGNRDDFEVILGDPVVVARLRAAADKYREEHGEKGAGKQKMKRKTTFTQECVAAALEHFKPQGLVKTGIEKNKESVLRFVINFFGKNVKVFDKFIIHRIYNVVAWHLMGDKFVDEMVEKVYRQMVNDV